MNNIIFAFLSVKKTTGLCFTYHKKRVHVNFYSTFAKWSFHFAEGHVLEQTLSPKTTKDIVNSELYG